jgi:signal transduction histidine kinase/ActR/RegA family two-component response regulator
MRLARVWANLSLRNKGLLVVSLPVLAFFALFASFFQHERNLQGVSASRQQALTLRTSTERVRTLIVDAESGVRGYLLTGEKSFLRPYYEALARLPRARRALAASARPDPSLANEVGETNSVISRRLAILNRARNFLPIRGATEPRLVPLLKHGKHVMDHLRRLFAEVERQATETTAARQRQERALRQRLGVLAPIAAALGLGGGLLAMLLFASGVASRVRRLQENAHRLQRGLPQLAPPEGTDEVGQLGKDLETAATLLQEREDELRAAMDAAQRSTLEAERARKEADRANRAKSEFLSRMSHELRTPLNGIIGFGQLLQMDSLPPDQAEAVHHIVRAGRHLLDLINEVLDIARVEAGALRISVEPVVVAEVVAETLDLIRPLAAERGVNVKLTPAAGCQEYVAADRQRFKQVLLNIVSNAIKYNVEGGRVMLSCETSSPDEIVIRVEDTGLGIAEDKLDRVFVPFDRAGAEQSEIEGTGLGLALSKALVEQMGGRIWVKSTVGKGSTFGLSLKRSSAPAEQPIASNQEDFPEPSVLSASHRVLCIEDNPANLKLIDRIMKRYSPNVELLSAMQGGMGLELARTQEIDLILLDLHLPDIPGEEVLRHLQEDVRTRSIPTIILTADAVGRRAERLLQAGAAAYLTKPIDVPRLLAVLKEALPPRVPAHDYT